jgi:hypothetical protein
MVFYFLFGYLEIQICECKVDNYQTLKNNKNSCLDGPQEFRCDSNLTNHNV